MKTARIVKSKVEDGIVKSWVKCPYCAKVNKHASVNHNDSRGCDYGVHTYKISCNN